MLLGDGASSNSLFVCWLCSVRQQRDRHFATQSLMLAVELRSLRSKDYLAYILVLFEGLLVELSVALTAWV